MRSSNALVHADFNDRVELDPPFREKSVEPFCLADRARKAVKDKTGFSIRRVNPVRNDAQHHMVRDERTRLDNHPNLYTNLGFRLHRRPQHLARRQMPNSQSVRDPHRLCALTRSRRPQYNQAHYMSPFDFSPFARAMLSTMRRLASAASPHPSHFTHLSGSRSL